MNKFYLAHIRKLKNISNSAKYSMKTPIDSKKQLFTFLLISKNCFLSANNLYSTVKVATLLPTPNAKELNCLRLHGSRYVESDSEAFYFSWNR